MSGMSVRNPTSILGSIEGFIANRPFLSGMGAALISGIFSRNVYVNVLSGVGGLALSTYLGYRESNRVSTQNFERHLEEITGYARTYGRFSSDETKGRFRELQQFFRENRSNISNSKNIEILLGILSDVFSSPENQIQLPSLTRDNFRHYVKFILQGLQDRTAHPHFTALFVNALHAFATAHAPNELPLMNTYLVPFAQSRQSGDLSLDLNNDSHLVLYALKHLQAIKNRTYNRAEYGELEKRLKDKNLDTLPFASILKEVIAEMRVRCGQEDRVTQAAAASRASVSSSRARQSSSAARADSAIDRAAAVAAAAQGAARPSTAVTTAARPAASAPVVSSQSPTLGELLHSVNSSTAPSSSHTSRASSASAVVAQAASPASSPRETVSARPAAPTRGAAPRTAAHLAAANSRSGIGSNLSTGIPDTALLVAPPRTVPLSASTALSSSVMPTPSAPPLMQQRTHFFPPNVNAPRTTTAVTSSAALANQRLRMTPEIEAFFDKLNTALPLARPGSNRYKAISALLNNLTRIAGQVSPEEMERDVRINEDTPEIREYRNCLDEFRRDANDESMQDLQLLGIVNGTIAKMIRIAKMKSRNANGGAAPATPPSSSSSSSSGTSSVYPTVPAFISPTLRSLISLPGPVPPATPAAVSSSVSAVSIAAPANSSAPVAVAASSATASSRSATASPAVSQRTRADFDPLLNNAPAAAVIAAPAVSGVSVSAATSART